MLNKIKINPRKQILTVYIVLILSTLAVFWQVNQYDFINLDDAIYVTDNDHIRSGVTLEGFRWAFSITYPDWWMPLLRLSYIFAYQLHGLNAGGYHLTNLIFHIMSTLLLFWFFNRMTKAIWKSAFVAAVFALHPLHVESVAWIAERKDVLSAFFWMLTLCLYVYYTEKLVIRRYLLVLFSFALALMSKPIVVTLPVIMILLDYWPLKRFESKKGNLFLWQLKEKMPFFVMSAVLVIITLYTTLYTKSNPSLRNLPIGFRISNVSVSFVTYLEKTFWPHDMAIFYPFSMQIPIWQVFGAFLLILIITTFVIVMGKRLPYLFVGWMWYSIAILPVIGIFHLGEYAMADRYHYLPSIGIATMLAWGIPSLFPHEDIRKKILFPASVTIMVIMAFITWHQCGYWRDSISIFSHALRVTKDNAAAHNFLAYDLDKKGKTNEAIYHYNEAIRIIPDFPEFYYNKGCTYAKLGQYQRAIEDFNEAIRLRPYYANAYNGRGCAYADTGQYLKAIENFNEAIRLEKDYGDAYYYRGVTYTKLHQYQLAFEDFNECIRIKPNYNSAYYNRGVLYLNHGYIELGCYDAQKACNLGNCELLEAAKRKGVCR